MPIIEYKTVASYQDLINTIDRYKQRHRVIIKLRKPSKNANPRANPSLPKQPEL